MSEDQNQELRHKTRELLALRARADELRGELDLLAGDWETRFGNGAFDTNLEFMTDLFELLAEKGFVEVFAESLRRTHEFGDFGIAYRESLNCKISKSGRLQVPLHLMSYAINERDACMKELESGSADFSRLERMIGFFRENIRHSSLGKYVIFPGRTTMANMVAADRSMVIRDIEAEAGALNEKFQKRYGAAAFTGNPQFAESFFHLAACSGLIEILWHIHRLDAPDIRLPDFERRYLATANQTAEIDQIVLLDPFDYVDRALASARDQKQKGERTEFDPAEQLITALGQLLDHDMLAPFRTGEEDPPVDPKSTTTALPHENENKEKLPRSFNEVYDLMRVAGRGGFAVVYEAWHKNLKVSRALKLMHIRPEDPEYETFVRRMAREGEVQANLKEHPNIVRLIDGGPCDEGYFLVMDFVAGDRTLRDLISDHKRAERKMSSQRIIEIMIGVIRGVAHAHRSGVIHRDLKPENIMLDSTGIPKVTDFGLAHSVDDKRLTRKGLIVATPEYVAPERVYGKTGSVASDIYSLGVVMHELALNIPPFRGEMESVLYQQEHEEVLAITPQRDVEFYEPLDSLILRCLTKKPEDRPQSADVILRELERFKEDLDTSSQSTERRSSLPKRIAGVSLLVVLLTAIAISGIFGFRNDKNGREKEDLGQRPEEREKENRKEEPKKDSPKNGGSKKEDPKKEPDNNGPRKDEPKKEEPKKEVHKPYQPTAAELALLARVPDLFEARTQELSKRVFTGLHADLLKFLEDESHTDYTKEKVGRVAQLPALASDVVANRHRELLESEDSVTVTLRDGSEITGIRAESSPKGLTLKLVGGSTLDVQLADLATADFEDSAETYAGTLAFLALDGSAAQVLERILATVAADASKRDILIPWIPALVRMARTQIRSMVLTAWAAKAKPRGVLLVKKIAAAVNGCHRNRERLSGLLAFVEEDLAELRREGKAFELLATKAYANALKSFPGTAAHPLAAREHHGAFVATLQENLFDTAEAWWLMWKLVPNPGKPDPNILTTDTEYDAVVLRDWSGKRSLTLLRPSKNAAAGARLRYRMFAGNKTKSPHWMLSLSGQDAFLRQDAKAVTLHVDGKQIARYEAASAEPAAAERTLTVFPDSELLWVYVDGKLAFFVSLDQVRLSKTPSVSVVGTELKIKEFKTR